MPSHSDRQPDHASEGEGLPLPAKSKEHTMSIPTISHDPRTVVVGYGGWGRLGHCYLVGLTPGLDLHGVVSSCPDKRKQIEEDQGCKAYETVDQAVADPDVDLLILSTPSHTHADLAVQALNAGKHVVTEKVMCLDLDECDRMIAAAEANERLLTVFQNRRLDGDYLTVRSLMDSGDLGDVRWIEMAWQGFGPWGNWRGESRLGGGRFYALGAHLVAQLLQFFPDPVECVYCRMHHDFPGQEVESDATIVVTFEGGRTGVLDLSSLAAISKPRFYIKGMDATFMKHGLDPQEAAMKAGDIDSAVEPEANYGLLQGEDWERTIPTLAGRWRTYFENLRDVLTKGAEPIVKLPECRRAMSVIDAALRSAKSGAPVAP